MTKLTDNYLPEVIVLIATIIAIGGIAFILIVVWWAEKPISRELGTFTEQPVEDPAPLIPTSPKPFRTVQLTELRARGRFGTVWEARLLDEIVAVKIFPFGKKQSWMVEKEFYKLPFMNHENILRYIGTETCGDNENIEFYLVTEFHPIGSLCDFLKERTINWCTLCKMAEGMLCGLSFLHGELPGSLMKADKCSIAHRDFKSKNVLIKSDLTVCIADFGLALRFEEGKRLGEIHRLVGIRHKCVLRYKK